MSIPTHDPEAWAERIAASPCGEDDGVHQFLTQQEERLEQAQASLQLLERLEEAGGAADGGIDRAPEQDYQRRYEMALDDLRELKAGNTLLQEQLSKARSTASALAKQTRTQNPCLDLGGGETSHPRRVGIGP